MLFLCTEGICTIYTQYIQVLKSFHGKNCFGFIGMNTSVQGRPPLHHYSSFQSLSFLKTITTTNNFFFCNSHSLSIQRDREQLGTGNKNYLEIKQTSAHENIHLRYGSPATAPEKVLISHKYRGSCVAFSISKSVKPNEELKVG